MHPQFATVAAVARSAAIFTLVVGWQPVWQRFRQHDPYLLRSEFLIPAIDMADYWPLVACAEGTLPEVYPRCAIEDLPYCVSHTHNDRAEFAADGGSSFLLLVLKPTAPQPRWDI